MTPSPMYFNSSPMASPHHRFFSSTPKDLPVKILYASQGGTAQIFAVQLEEALEEQSVSEVTIQGLHEDAPQNILQPGKAFHVLLAATAGVGEPPDNARNFSEWLTSQTEENASSQSLEGLDFCVFALGNQKAHPNHYNVFGKGLDKKLEALGATRLYELGLGDDGDCIEDDYDTWVEAMIQSVYQESEDNGGGEDEEETGDVAAPVTTTAVVEDPNVTLEPCIGSKEQGKKRLISAKYDRLQLTPSKTDISRDDLLHLKENPFYIESTQALPVLTNRPLNCHAGENGLHEMRLSLENTNDMTYETGDHLMVYPQNSETMVEAYLQQMDVDPNVTIDVSDEDTRYPHPTGITLTETLRHCVDLSAVPSPNVARILTGRQKIDYKNEIATPRRTILDLLAKAPRKYALEEILGNLPPMKARYYSIASSSLVHPNELYLVYRPVNYTTTQGHLRLGVATSYMKNMMGAEDASLDDYNLDSETTSSHLIAAVNSNPTFRLPSQKQTPVLFIAGGCGIAPIRAFLEERIHAASQRSPSENNHDPFGEGYLFLGFRSPWDAPYKSLVEQAFQCGAISNLHITYNAKCSKATDGNLLGDNNLHAHTSCGLVSDAVGEHGEQLYSFFERGGHTYICGGARLFGVAIENQVHLLLQSHGNLSENEATKYLQRLLEEGRYVSTIGAGVHIGMGLTGWLKLYLFRFNEDLSD